MFIGDSQQHMPQKRNGLDVSDIDGAKSRSMIKPYKKGANFEKNIDPASFAVH
jgi:hypothetical protein